MSAVRVESVLVDQREPSTTVEELRAAFPDVPVATALLDTGDAWLATSDGALLVVERKTPQDLLSSIDDGRLFAQVAQMREVSAWAYLVVTGPVMCGSDGLVWLERRSTRWNYDAVQGALVSVQESGVAVVTCRDRDYGGCLGRLASRSRGVSRVPPSRPIGLAGPGEVALAALPGIGPERVDALLTYCGTPALALVYLSGNGNGESVPGVGPKTRAAVRHALGLYPNTKLEVIGTNESEKENNT